VRLSPTRALAALALAATSFGTPPAVAAEASPPVPHTAVGITHDDQRIVQFDPNNGQSRTLAVMEPGTYAIGIALSPDGKYLAGLMAAGPCPPGIPPRGCGAPTPILRVRGLHQTGVPFGRAGCAGTGDG